MRKTLVFVPTNKCNMECKYCLFHIADEYPKAEYEDMSIAIIDSIMEQYAEEELCGVHFSGGEPMLCADLIKHFLKNYKQRVRILTNGTVIPDDELLQLMKDYDEIEISLSIDSADSIPPLYHILAENDITMYATAVIDETDLQKNVKTFQLLNSLKLKRYELSPDYLSPNTQELFNFYCQLGAAIGETIIENNITNISSYGELISVFDRLHADKYEKFEEDHPEVIRFAPDGSTVPSIVHTAVKRSTPNFNNLFPMICDMSAKFHDAPKEFLSVGRLTHQHTLKTSPSSFYFAHMINNIITKLEERYTIEEIFSLFGRQTDEVKWIK